MVAMVHYNGKNTTFLGRNGRFCCSALEVDSNYRSGFVSLIPFTSREEPARCEIEVPLEAIPRLIEALQSVSASTATESAG